MGPVMVESPIAARPPRRAPLPAQQSVAIRDSMALFLQVNHPSTHIHPQALTPMHKLQASGRPFMIVFESCGVLGLPILPYRYSQMLASKHQRAQDPPIPVTAIKSNTRLYAAGMMRHILTKWQTMCLYYCAAYQQYVNSAAVGGCSEGGEWVCDGRCASAESPRQAAAA